MKRIMLILLMFINNDCTSIDNDTTDEYIKITHIALNRDKYYGPFIISSGNGDIKKINDDYIYVFYIGDEKFKEVRNFIYSYSESLDSSIIRKGTCNNCYNISVYKGDSVKFGYDIITDKESKQHFLELTNMLNKTSENDTLIQYIKTVILDKIE